MMPMGTMPGMGMGMQPQGSPAPTNPKPAPNQRKPFRSISQVLDTPVTPELLAALPAPVQDCNLVMGSKLTNTVETEADRDMVNSAMASLNDTVTLLVVAQQQNLVDLFRNLIAQLPMKIQLKTAVGRKALIEELDRAAKAIVEGSGRQMDLVLCDPEVVKQDGQLVSTLHSKYSVPIVLFSSTGEAVHSQLVDDWMIGPGNGDVKPTQLAAKILKWHAKSTGKPEPLLSNPNAAPSPPPPNPQAQPMQAAMHGGGIGGGMPGMGGNNMASMGMMQQASAPFNGNSPGFAPLVEMLKAEIAELRQELETKTQIANVPKDVSKIAPSMFKSQEGQNLATQLVNELKSLKEQKLAAKQAAESAAAAAADKARREAEAKAAEEKKRMEEEARIKAEKRKQEEALERKRQEEEAIRRQKEAIEAARAALTPSQRRMNAFKLASHQVVVDMDE